MYDNSSDGRSYCKLAAYLTLAGGMDTGVGDYEHLHQYVGDVLLGFDTSTEAPGLISGWMPTADCLGIPRSEFNRGYPVSFVVHKPEVQRYDWREDYKNYYLPGSSFWSGNPDRNFEHENQVVHVTFRGDVRDKTPDYVSNFVTDPGRLVNPLGFGRPGNVTSFFPGYDTSKTRSWGARFLGTDPKGFSIFEPDAYVDNRPTYSLKRYLDALDYWMPLTHDFYYLMESGMMYGAWVGASWVNRSRIMDGLNKQILDVEYDYVMVWNPSGAGGRLPTRSTFHVHKYVEFEFVPWYGTNFPTLSNHPTDKCLNVVDKTTVSIAGEDFPYGGSAIVRTIPRVGCYTTTIAGTLHDEESTDVPNFVRFRFADKSYLNRRTDLLRGAVYQNLGDIRPSSFLSSADALNKHLQLLDANHVQTLSQLDGILGLLPDISSLPSLVKKIADGDISAIKDLIDYLSDAILRYRFAQKPNARNLQEVLGATAIDQFLTSLGRSTSNTIYGKFNWTFPMDQNFMEDGTLVLETRSKHRITSDASTLVASCLMANAVGLLPTLSRIWESLPFSFVVDWFIAMNKRLKLLDTQLLYMAHRTDWSLYSYKVTYYPSQEMLDQFNLESFNLEEPFGITVYMREKSAYMPRLRTSRYDFVGSGGFNALTAGSLVWQLLS